MGLDAREFAECAWCEIALPACRSSGGGHGRYGDYGVLKGVEFGRDFAASIEVAAGFSRSDRVMDGPRRCEAAMASK